MSINGEFSLQPDQCVNYYAKQNMEEDICDSMVAYIYDPQLLQGVSPDKLNIFQKHDAKQPLPQVTSKRMKKEEIVNYFIQEPEPVS